MSALPPSPSPAPDASLLERWRALRSVGFGAFLSARVLATFAVQMQAVIVAWQVYEITRDPMALAWVGLAQFLPMLLLLVPAGDLSDRMSRKRILVASWLLGALCSALLWGLSWQEAPTVGWIYAVLVLFGVSRAFNGPALQSLLPQVVPRNQLAQALATNSMLMRTSAIAAPVLGGVTYAWGGALLTYALCALALLAAVVMLLRVPVRYGTKRAPVTGSLCSRFLEGAHFIRTRPIVLGTISLDLFAVLLGGVVALLPVYASEVLHVGPQGLGVLRASMAAGEVLMGLALNIRPVQRHVGRIMFAAVALFGLANLVFALSTWFWLSAVALAVAGACDMVSVYIRSALVQFATPDAMRGRVNSVNMLFISSSNELGEFRAGASASGLGAVPAAVVGGACTLVVVALWMRIFPSLQAVDRMEDASRDESAPAEMPSHRT